MKTFGKSMALSVLLMTGLMASSRAADIGKSAPAFTATASDGKTYSLEELKGKFVVLQWYNRDCPFIHKHYDGGHMQALQERYGQKGVVWLEVISSAPGHEGYLSPEDAQKNRVKSRTKSDATLIDADGKVGRLYAAKTTPHVFIVDPKGILIYQGAIDDHNSADASDIPRSKNYVAAALDEALAGKPVTTPQTRPYGCGVKYQ